MLGKSFMGKEFIWFQGVVESIDDPLRLGRVQVRSLGFHTDDKVLLPTSSLPWAHPLQPITSAAISGIGTSPTGILNGSWVIGFFRDGILAQEPIIMGTIGGIPIEKADSSKGFYDPDGIFPKEDMIDESDTSRLAREEYKDHRSMIVKNGNILKDYRPGGLGDTEALKKLDKRVPTAVWPKMSKVGPRKLRTAQEVKKWTEPTPRGGKSSKYPFNKVFESVSGHVKEYDDTPGNKRIHEYHAAGTFEEIQDNGTRVTKIVEDNYQIVAGDDYVYVQGNVNVTIKGDCNLLVEGNMTTQVKKDYYLSVHGNKIEKIDGSHLIEVGTDYSLSAGTGINQHTDGSKSDVVNGNYSVIYKGDYNLTAKDINIAALGSLTTKAVISAQHGATNLSLIGGLKASLTGGLSLEVSSPLLVEVISGTPASSIIMTPAAIVKTSPLLTQLGNLVHTGTAAIAGAVGITGATSITGATGITGAVAVTGAGTFTGLLTSLTNTLSTHTHASFGTPPTPGT